MLHIINLNHHAHLDISVNVFMYVLLYVVSFFIYASETSSRSYHKSFFDIKNIRMGRIYCAKLLFRGHVVTIFYTTDRHCCLLLLKTSFVVI